MKSGISVERYAACTSEKMASGVLLFHTYTGHYTGSSVVVDNTPSSLWMRAVGWTVVGILAMVVGIAPVEIAFNPSIWIVFKVLLGVGVGASIRLLYGALAPPHHDKGAEFSGGGYYYVTNEGVTYYWMESQKPSIDKFDRERLYKKYGWFKMPLSSLPPAARESLGRIKPEILLLG